MAGRPAISSAHRVVGTDSLRDELTDLVARYHGRIDDSGLDGLLESIDRRLREPGSVSASTGAAGRLQAAIRRVAGVRDREALLEVLVVEAAVLAEARAASVWLLDVDKQIAPFPTVFTTSQWTEGPLALEICQTLPTVLETVPERPWLQSPPRSPGPGEVVVEAGTLTQRLWLPLRVAGRLVAAIRLDYAAGMPASAIDSDILALFATEAGSVLALMQAREHLRSAEAISDQFMSLARHELKTPLTSIKATAQLAVRRLERLQQGDTLSGASGLAHVVGQLRGLDEQVNRMSRLIDALGDASRMLSGRLELRLTPIDLVALARATLERFAESQQSHGVEFVGEGAPGGCQVMGDRRWLEEALVRLLGNAVKFSAAGTTVRVTVSVLAGDEGISVVQLAVQDQGVGLAAEEKAALLDRWRPSPAAWSRGGQSSGLGLFIVHEVVRLHGGTVSVESERGCGSTFQISLPLC